MQLPKENPIRIVQYYADGREYEMETQQDIDNHQSNLQAVAPMLFSRMYIEMKPVNWKKNK